MTLPAHFFELFALLMLTGAAGGMLSGLLGIGGGVIFVPALFYSFQALGMDETHTMHLAIGTSLAIVLATSASSAFHHHKLRAVDIAIVKSWGPFIVLGVVLGSTLASLVHGHTLKEIFAVLMMLMAVYMLLPKKIAGAARTDLSLFVIQGACTVIGMISAMIGSGGAILNVPMMSYTGVPIRRAVATSAALGLAVALPGMLGYILSGLAHSAELPPLSLGYISLPAVIVIAPMSMLLAPFGVRLSHSLPKKTLRRIFSVMLILVSLHMFFTL